MFRQHCERGICTQTLLRTPHFPLSSKWTESGAKKVFESGLATISGNVLWHLSDKHRLQDDSAITTETVELRGALCAVLYCFVCVQKS